MEHNIIVFLGPSLPLNKAKRILPNAFFLPPVRCGNIFQAMRLNPKVIAIIDGVFENTAAIWHKEILFAIENGVKVFGASSMGALRAAELADLGMIGVGDIFQKFYDGTYNDDDEVAVLHSRLDDYAAINEPMANIRATLKKARGSKKLDSHTAELICDGAKNLFYRDRSFDSACNIALENGTNKKIINEFKNWLNNGGYVDQKGLDAIELLHVLKKIDISESKKNAPPVYRSVFIRTLQKNIMCRPFTTSCDWLPATEKIAMAARFLNKKYKLTRNLAHMLATFDALATTEIYEFTPSPSSFPRKREPSEGSQYIKILPQNITNKEWEQNNDCFGQEKTDFIERIDRIQRYASNLLAKNPTSTDKHLLNLLRSIGDYPEYNKNPATYKTENPIKTHTLELLTNLWTALSIKAENINIQPAIISLQTQADLFRRQHKLYTPEATNVWLSENNLDLAGFQDFITDISKFNFMVFQNNLDIFKISKYTENVWWLLDSMRITGIYKEAKRITTDKDYKKIILEKLRNDISDNPNQNAFALDFSYEEQEFL